MDVEDVYTLYELGVVMDQTTRINNDKALLQDVMNIHMSSIGNDNQGREHTLYRLSKCFRSRGQGQSATRIWEHAVKRDLSLIQESTVTLF